MIDTGLKKRVKPSKAVTVLKQDRQAFGTLLSKSVDLEEAFAYPVTSVPLSITNPDSTLRQSSKHLLRNHHIEESHSLPLTSPSHCRWTIDGMATMRSLKRIHIEGFDQKMVQGNDWLSFFNHIKNKNDLVKAASRFFRQAEIRSN